MLGGKLIIGHSNQRYFSGLYYNWLIFYGHVHLRDLGFYLSKNRLILIIIFILAGVWKI